MQPDMDSWQRLLAADGIGPVLFRQLVKRFGSPGQVLAASLKELCALPHIDEKRAQAILEAAKKPLSSSWTSQLERLGVTVLTCEEPNYPRRLLTINDYPPLLFVRGQFTERDDLAVAVVGSRRASTYGQRVAKRLVEGLVERGLTVVSGLARGIDSVAHRAALAAGGRTIAVLGCGVDVDYPVENSSLADRIAEGGAVVSEFPLGTEPEAGHFPRRNRLISALSFGVVVVEAREKSGALLTAHLAADQGREVFAVPGNIDQPRSQGPHRLIQEGAKLVQSVEDILEELPLPKETPLMNHVARPMEDLTLAEQKILDLMTDQPASVDDLIARSGLQPQEMLALLLSLEMKGRVQQLAGQRFISA